MVAFSTTWGLSFAESANPLPVPHDEPTTPDGQPFHPDEPASKDQAPHPSPTLAPGQEVILHPNDWVHADDDDTYWEVDSGDQLREGR